MSLATELAALFERDLKKLVQQVRGYTDEDSVWHTAPGISNSAGNLMLHLEGNQREYIGRLLGGIPYVRTRDLEFSLKGIPLAEIASRLEEVVKFVPYILGRLTEEQLGALYPQPQEGARISTQKFLIHLHGHLNYHLGQIDYHRRMLTGGPSLH
jgi:hypothetical protein